MRNLKKIIIIILCVLGVGFLTSLLFKSFAGDTEKVFTTFAVGCIDETGDIDDSELSIYTKKAIEFEVLVVDWDEEKNGTYQLFFYDEDDEFVSASEVYNADAEIEMVEGATQARLVITPTLEEDDEINFFEVVKYSSYVKLNKEAKAETDAE